MTHHSKRIRDAFAQASALAAQVLSKDLRGLPMYCLDSAVLGYDLTGSCGGFTSLALDIFAREFLESQGLWKGRGFAFCLDLEQFAKLENSGRGYLEFELTALVLHETTHAVSDRLVERVRLRRDFDPPPATIAEVRSSDIADATVPLPPKKIAETHSLKVFGRLCCHVSHRARLLAGRTITPWAIFACPGGEMMPRIERALSAEVHNLEGLPLAAILKIPPPESFSNLFPKLERTRNE